VRRTSRRMQSVTPVCVRSWGLKSGVSERLLAGGPAEKRPLCFKCRCTRCSVTHTSDPESISKTKLLAAEDADQASARTELARSSSTCSRVRLEKKRWCQLKHGALKHGAGLLLAPSLSRLQPGVLSHLRLHLYHDLLPDLFGETKLQGPLVEDKGAEAEDTEDEE